MSDYLTVSELSARLGVPRERVKVWCRLGKLPGAKLVNRWWLIPADAVAPQDKRGVYDRSVIKARALEKARGL